MSYYGGGEYPLCPHCGAGQEDGPVEDYVVPGILGMWESHECVNCDEVFRVCALADGFFEVRI
jgi:hypothetical protein